MRKITLILLTIICIGITNAQSPITDGPDWTVTNITSDNELTYANTILYGPDGYLWITERIGEKIVKIDPDLGGSKISMLDLSSEVNSFSGQDGLLGMAIHPDLYDDINTPNNFVFVAYSYDDGGNQKFRISRYTYNTSTGNLNSGSATTIIEGLPASFGHNGGKLVIGPPNVPVSERKLFYSIGDQEKNRNSTACEEIRAQYFPTSGGQTQTTGDKSEYQGKILRMNLDGSIPSDNPVLGGFKTHIYTYGHRNAQGIIFGQSGKLYSSEHGDKVDDEINIIYAGKNYGWPLISGYNDGTGYEYCNWSSSVDCGSYDSNSCPLDGDGAVTESTSYAIISSDFQEPIGTYNSTEVPTGGWLSWPTVAPSSISIYEGGEIPDWGESLLIPSLKRGTIFRSKLNISGDALEDDTSYEEFHSSNDRYRDICMDPDGVTMYAITDNSGTTTGPSGSTPQTIENPGVVMKIEFTGTTLSSDKLAQAINFNVSPNPAKDSFKINYDNINGFNVDIVDIQGRIIKAIKSVSKDTEINTSDLSNGIYFVKVYNDNTNEIGTKKLVIKK